MDGADVRQSGIALQELFRFIGPVIRQEIVQQIRAGQPGPGVFLHKSAIEFDGLAVIDNVPVPGRMPLCLLQDPLAVLFIRRCLHRLPGIATRLAGIALHPVPIEIGHQPRRAFLVLRFAELTLQKRLILHEQILRQILLRVKAVLNAVEALLTGQVEQVVDTDAEDFRQQRERRDIRHRCGIFPFRNRLRADSELLGKLFLREPGPKPKLSDLLPEFHDDSPPADIATSKLQVYDKACAFQNQ